MRVGIMRRAIRRLIAQYVYKYEHGSFIVKRKGGSEQVCRMFSKQAHENIVKPALECKGIFYTKEQLNMAIEETIKAVRNCGEDSDCYNCYLYIKNDDCVLNHVINNN